MGLSPRRVLLLLLLPGAARAEPCLDAAARALDAGENAAAARALEACPKETLRRTDVRRSLGRVRFLAGDAAGAKALLKEEDDDPFSLLTRARIVAGEGRAEDALGLLDRLLESAPWRPLVLLLKGEALEAAGRPGEAEEAYRAALAQDASFSEARPPLARLAEARGDHDAAWRQWDRVAAASPRSPAAKDALSRLEPKLSKKPEELRPTSRLASHRGAPCPPEAWRGPFVKIGIATDGRGRPQPLKEAVFRVSAPFEVLSGGKVLARGKAGERWTLRGRPEGGVALLGPDGKAAGRSSVEVTVRARDPAASTLIVEGLTYAPGFVWSGASDKELRGDLQAAGRADGSLRLAARMPLEAYLYGVVGAEMPSTWPDEALRTQAVVARTYAEARRAARPHARDGYDLCDEQHCQVYAGAAREAESVRRAVDGSRGEVLTVRGRPARTPYSSNCGGHGRSAGEVWGFGGDDLKGLPEEPAAPDGPWAFRRWVSEPRPAACRTSRFVPAAHHRWARVFDAVELESAVRRVKDVGPLRRVAVARRGPGGHVTALVVAGERGEVRLERDADVRRFLGDGPLRSALYAVETEEKDGRPRRVFVFGGGWGHGVGLCQAGAAGRAEAGDSHEAILAHYFPAAAISRIDGGNH